MPEIDRRVRVEEFDWLAAFPWLRLFRSFRMAVDPYKMALALLLVVLVYVGGRLLDAAWPTRVTPGEIDAFATQNQSQFQEWQAKQEKNGRSNLAMAAATFGARVDAENVTPRQAIDAVHEHFKGEDERLDKLQKDLLDSAGDSDVTDRLRRLQQRRDDLIERRERALREIRDLTPRGIFDQTLRYQLECFSTVVAAATALNFGMGDMLRGGQAQSTTVLGALRQMFVTVPAWLYHAHPWFLLLFTSGALVVWSVVGGSIARIAALEATRDEPQRGTAAVRFAYGRIGWFLLTPLFPFIIAGILGLVLILSGFVFFNLPVLDMVGGLGFVLALSAGFIIAFLLLLSAAASHLFYPALAIEGTDTFDVISRAFGYVINRPWQWLFYTLVALVYGAVTYLFIGGLIFLTLAVTQYFINAGVVASAAEGVGRFEAMLPPPQFGVLAHEVNWSMLSLPGKAAAAFIWVWVFLLVGALAAYAVSYYVCSHTWIYLLLRQATDGTDYDEVYIAAAEPEGEPSTDRGEGLGASADPAAPVIPDKIEPTGGNGENGPGSPPASPPA